MPHAHGDSSDVFRDTSTSLDLYIIALHGVFRGNFLVPEHLQYITMATTPPRPKRWWENAPTPYQTWNSSSKGRGVKADGGGSTRGQSKVGGMEMFHAVVARDANRIVELADAGVSNVNEVDAAGNTPLHLACFAGDEGVVSLLLQLGALLDASNNAGDRPIHWAMAMEVRYCNNRVIVCVTRIAPQRRGVPLSSPS